MTSDEIIARLGTSMPPDAEALRAGVAQADAVAPAIYQQLARFSRGVCLMPREANLLYVGLHVLAAARHRELWQRLIELARAPEEEIDDVFRRDSHIALARLMLSAWDGDGDGLLHLIEHADLCDTSRQALMATLARVTFDGRIPSERTAQVLERFVTEALADWDSMVWIAWVQAVVSLGLVRLRPQLEQVLCDASVHSLMTGADRDETLREMERHAAEPGDASPFERLRLQTIDDPVAALSWIAEGLDEMVRMVRASRDDEPEGLEADRGDDGANVDEGLEIDELLWLERFLMSRQVPASAMTLTMLDGYLTAIAIGPERIAPADYLPLVWGSDGEQPGWDGDQSQQVEALIATHLAGIAACRDAAAEHAPLIATGDEDQDEHAAAWAEGFAVGIDAHEAAWKPLFEDRRGCEEVLAVLALCDDETEYLGRPATADERAQILDRLPQILQRIAAYWRDPARKYPRSAPIRVQKIGRNDPCPCGSGKKYKRCCALSPPTLN